MRESRGRLSSLMAMIAIGAGMSAAASAIPDSHPAQRTLRGALGSSGSWGGSRQGRPGWSVATDRRRAKKARNVARNRKAHRA